MSSILYTDGVSEAMNERDEVYGEERLGEDLGRLCAESCDDILQALARRSRQARRGRRAVGRHHHGGVQVPGAADGGGRWHDLTRREAGRPPACRGRRAQAR